MFILFQMLFERHTHTHTHKLNHKYNLKNHMYIFTAEIFLGKKTAKNKNLKPYSTKQ